MTPEQEYSWSKFIRKSMAEVLLDITHQRWGGPRYGEELTQRFLKNAAEMGLLTGAEAQAILTRIPADAQREREQK